LPGFSLLDLAAATECLNNANALLGYEAYRWRTFALGTQHAVASNGITLRADCATDKPVHADRMFVLAEQHPETAGDAPLLGWLRTLDKSGCKVGAIGSGTYTLARAELIGERACTVHWQSAPKLCEAFPAIRLSGNIFAIDAGLLTCSGGTAVVDMLMRLVTHDHGRDICEQLQSHLHVERARTECDPQQTVPLAAMNARPRKLQTAIRQMEAQLQTPTSPNHIAAQIRCYDATHAKTVSGTYRRLSWAVLHEPATAQSATTVAANTHARARCSGCRRLHITLAFLQALSRTLRRDASKAPRYPLASSEESFASEAASKPPDV